MTSPIVETAQGRLRGSSATTPGGPALERFLGIRYAAPPVGALRWRAPQPPAAWTGARDATEFAPGAPQRAALESRLPGFRPDHPTDEDCLALNVWTPRREGSRPVIVWLPGGGYQSGGTAQPVYDAARLASEADAVVVTVGYRLGALGYLGVAGGDTNCGLRDQLAALAWIAEHAAVFGGDPGRVTVMGESAGAGSVLHLLASPHRAGLFGRAVAQSGEPRTVPRAMADEVADRFAQQLDATPTADALRSIAVERLLDAQTAVAIAMLGKLGPMAFAPAIDDDVCVAEIVEGVTTADAVGVDLVLGTTRDELALFPDPKAATLEDDRLTRRMSHLLGADASDAVRIYRAQLGAGATSGAIWDAARTDAMMRVPNLRVADAHAAAGGRTFVYRFDWAAPEIGAAHGVDLPFTFGTQDREGWDAVVGWDGRADALAATWRSAWASFAATGDPGSRSRPWPLHDPVRRSTMVFAPDAVGVVDDPDAATRRVWMD